MTIATVGSTPEWVGLLTEADLAVGVGHDTVLRGLDYHSRGRVKHLVTSGTKIVAAVSGSRGRSYTTTVSLLDLEPGRHIEWGSSCTCPMQEDCKHAVAAVLAARDRVSTPPVVGDRGRSVSRDGRRRAEPAPWEQTFAPVVRSAVDRCAPPTGIPLGLLISVVRTRPGRGAPVSAASAHLTLRPVVPGANGGWIRTGISWNDLEYAYYGRNHRPTHRETLRAIRLAERISSTAYYSNGQTIDATAVGPQLWRLLDEAVQAGVALVSGAKGQREVGVLPEPLDVVLDLARAGSDGLVARALVDLPGADGRVELIGQPAHAVFVESGDSLTLARLAHPLDAALAHLLVSGDAVRVPATDVDRFLAHYLPALRQHARVESSDGSVDIPPVQPPRLALQVSFEEGHRAALHWCFRYATGSDRTDVPLVRGQGTGQDGVPVLRDAAAEESLLASLDVLGAVPGLRTPRPGLNRLAVVVDPLLTGLDTAVFAGDVLPLLQARDDIDVTVSGSPMEYAEATEAPVVTVSTHDLDEDAARPLTSGSGSAQTGIDWFDLGIVVTVGEEQVPLARLLAALTNHESHLILDSGTWFRLDAPELHALARILEEARGLQDHESDGLRISPFQAGMWEELVSLGVVAHQSEAWTRSVGPLLALEELPRPSAPSGAQVELRDYQLDGYQWLSLLWDHRLGGVLADDMGLGKTVQTLAMAERARELGTLTPEAPLLIVAPTSVVSTWVRESERFTPDVKVVAVTETCRRRGTTLAEAAAGAHVVVTSYALFRIEEDAYREQVWSGLVLDEAQFVKNHQAKTYRAARRLPAPFKLAITGTPLENSLMDLWSLLSIVAPGLFPTPERFGELYRKPIESGADPARLQILRRRIRPLMLRRTKEAVAADLPPKVEQVLTVQLNPQHRRIYDTHLQRERQRILGLLGDVDRNRIAIFRALTKLRQLSLDVHLVDPEASSRVRSSKVDALLDQLVEVAAEGHRCLVFSQFTGFLRIVRDRLAEEGIDHVYLDGRTRNRPARIAQFTDGDAPVFVISLKAGGSGLTLTEADYVFVLDPWWNPAVEAQAVDRAHRIGQDKTVMVYRLVSEGTIEEKVVALQERKRDLFTRVVDDGGLMAAPLTADDIRGLLGA